MSTPSSQQNNYCCIWNGFIADPYTTDACADFSPESKMKEAIELVEKIKIIRL